MLIRTDGLSAEDQYAILDDQTPFGESPVIVSLPRAIRDRDRLIARAAPFGVMLFNDVRLEEVAPLLDDASLFAIVFPTFSDGRGFSLARRLRLAGFSGSLRAVGPVIPDQIRHARAVGFDEISLPNNVASRHSAEDWRIAASIISNAYQEGYFDGTIVERRRQARGLAR